MLQKLSGNETGTQIILIKFANSVPVQEISLSPVTRDFINLLVKLEGLLGWTANPMRLVSLHFLPGGLKFDKIIALSYSWSGSIMSLAIFNGIYPAINIAPADK